MTWSKRWYVRILYGRITTRHIAQRKLCRSSASCVGPPIGVIEGESDEIKLGSTLGTPLKRTCVRPELGAVEAKFDDIRLCLKDPSQGVSRFPQSLQGSELEFSASFLRARCAVKT